MKKGTSLKQRSADIESEGDIELTSEEMALIIPKIINMGSTQALWDAYQLTLKLEKINSQEISYTGHKDGETYFIYDETNFALSHDYMKKIRSSCTRLVKDHMATEKTMQLYWLTHLFDARFSFDSFMLYMEKDREPSKQFYMPRRKQLLPIVNALQELEDGDLELLTISLPPGTGKALANDTPIMTRNGWKNHGDLVVGDEVVGLDGKFKKVVAVHPKCVLDRKVEFTNGETIVCHENHEWLVHDRGRHNKDEQDYIAETKRLEKRKLESGGLRGHRGHRYVLQLPKRGYMEGTHKELPLDPYLFGVWLGDGVNKNPTICGSKSDYAIVEKILSKGYEIRWQTEHKTTHVMYYGLDIRKELQKYDLCHSRRTSPKYIPDDYLTADINQRLELLAGLIDTDGTMSRNCRYQFTTSDVLLKETFIELISTFGWRCCIKTVAPKTSTSGISARKEHYVIAFCPDLDVPCVLERKRLKSFAEHRAIGIKSITKTEPREGNCITVEGDGMYLAGKMMIPTHNTTLAEFFLAWTSGLHPELPNLICSHNASFVGGVYNEMLRMLDRNGEYRWTEVFPQLKVVKTNAKDFMIDIGTSKKMAKRFATLEFISLGGGNAGKVRAMNIAYSDDLVPGIEVAMSKEQLDKVYQKYITDFRQRKQGNRVKELHIATRWSVHDPIGRLEVDFAENPKAKFIRIPALDENDESNFDYPYGLGYTTEFLHEQRAVMDDASWKALYMNEPIEREGQLYAPDELTRYSELPEVEADAIIAVCDIADGGGDYWAMPICYQYGNTFYVDKFICDNGKPDIVEDRIVDILIDMKVQLCQFESNRGGGVIAENVSRKIKERNGITHITSKWNQTNKETRIIVNSGWVKSHCLFHYDSYYKQDREYGRAMAFLTSYTMAGRNKHDDIPDVMSSLALFTQTMSGRKAIVKKRTF